MSCVLKKHLELRKAILHQDKASIRAILEQDKNEILPDSKDENGDTPLHYAVSTGNGAIVLLLLACCSDYDVQNKYGDSPLHIAVYKGFDTIVHRLILAKVNVNIQNLQGETPLQLGISNCKSNIVKMLLDSDAKLDVGALCEKMAFITALWLEQTGLNKLLLSYNLDLNPDAAHKVSLLQKAVSKNNLAMTNLLLRCKAYRVIYNQSECSPLHFIQYQNTKSCHHAILRLLLDYDANVNGLQHGKTPLHRAIENNDLIAVKLLLTYGARLQINDSQGKTPLQLCLRGRARLDRIARHIIAAFVLESIPIEWKDIYSHFTDECISFSFRCQNELDQMKNLKLDKSTITYFHILKKSTNEVATFLQNKEVSKFLVGKIHEIIFPCYKHMLKIKLCKSDLRRSLYERGLECFKRFTKVLPLLPMEKIINQLSNQDLRNLICASS